MNIKDIKKSTLVLLSIGSIGLLLIAAWDKFYWHVKIFREGSPDFSPPYLI